MNCKRLLTFLLIVCSTFTAETCKKNIIVQPPDEIPPGRRDYEWAVDTLKLQSGDLLTITRIWGSARNDVWITGFGSPSWTLLWHYDGVSWRKDSVQRQISPWGIYGFGKNEVWLVNSDGSIWKYDGSAWHFATLIKADGFQRVEFLNVYGLMNNSVFTVGHADMPLTGSSYKGVIARYDGAKWELLRIPDIQISFTNVRLYTENTGKLYRVI